MTVENVLSKLDRNLGRFLIIAETAPVLGANKGNFISMTFNDERLVNVLSLEVYAIGLVNNMIAIYV